MKIYRPYCIDQLLLSRGPRDWLPEDHLPYFISDLVGHLDLSPILRESKDETWGYQPYHPVMMVKVLVYAYAARVYSFPQIARRVVGDLAFRVLGAGNFRDFRSIAAFRERHLKALADLFVQVLKPCKATGLVKLRESVLDDSKVLANASKHTAMSHRQVVAGEAQLKGEFHDPLDRAAALGAQEDGALGSEARGEGVAKVLTSRQNRVRKDREVQAALRAGYGQVTIPAEAPSQRGDPPVASLSPQEPFLFAEPAVKCPAASEPPATSRGHGASLQGPQPSEVPPKRHRNFAGPDSRIIPRPGKLWVQAYNVQTSVESAYHVIVHTTVTDQSVDTPRLIPMTQGMRARAGANPCRCLAYARPFSDENVAFSLEQGNESFIAADKQRHGRLSPSATRGRIPKHLSVRERMQRKLATRRGRRTHGNRKAGVEPV